jgi:hypothetical protein
MLLIIAGFLHVSNIIDYIHNRNTPPHSPLVGEESLKPPLSRGGLEGFYDT